MKSNPLKSPKSFKKYLNESPTYNRTIEHQMSLSALPITDKVAENLGFNYQAFVFHATDLSHLKNLDKLGKTDKSISTFTKGFGSLMNGGMAGKPDVVAKLKGNVLMEFEGDAFSHPDKNGMRWINTRGVSKSDFLQDALMGKIIKEMYAKIDKSKYPFEDYDKFYDEMRYDDKIFQDTFKSLDKKNQEKIINMYIKNAENLMSKPMYSKIVNKLLTRKDSGFDEIIMNHFKIVGVYAVEAGRFAHNHDNAEKAIEDMGYVYLGFIPKSKFKEFSTDKY